MTSRRLGTALLIGLFTLLFAAPGIATAAPPPMAAQQVTNPEAFVRAAYADFLDREPTAAELSAAVARPLATSAERSRVVWELSRSREWIARTVEALYQSTLGRPADPSGLNYWVDILQREKASTARVAAHFYASSEYFNGIGGGHVSTWITDLYRKILDREPDTGGLAYWSDQTARRGRVSVAFSMYQSLESRQGRIADLYQHLLRRAPDPAGMTYWSARIRTLGDLTLAAALASSAEYYAAAPARFVTVVAPGSPTGVEAQVADSNVTVSWDAPAADGGAAITQYAVTSSPIGASCTTSGATTCDVTGLTPDTTYTFTVTATNSAGTSAPSAASNPVMVGSGTWLPVTPAAASARWSPQLIAENGLVVGYETDSITGNDRAMWCAAPCGPQSTIQPLAVPHGLERVDLVGVSPSGTIIANGRRSSGDDSGLIWTDPTAPPTVIMPTDTYTGTVVAGIADDGTIVGGEINFQAIMGRGTMWDSSGALLATVSKPASATTAQLNGYAAGHGMVGTATTISRGPTITNTPYRWDSTTATPAPLLVPGDAAGTNVLAMATNGMVLGSLRVVWDAPNAVPHRLPIPTGATGVEATGISPTGSVVGSAVIGGTRQGVVWSPAGDATVLAGLAGVTDVRATAMTASGNIVGGGTDANGERVALRWDNTTDATPEALGVASTGQGPVVRGLTSDGHLVGQTGTSAAVWAAPSATPVAVNAPNGVDTVTVNAVAADGSMVGIATTGTGSSKVTQALYWSSATAAPTVLAQPSGVTAVPIGVNTAGQIISERYFWETPTSDPTALPIYSTTTSAKATALSNAGMVVGRLNTSTGIFDQGVTSIVRWSSPSTAPVSLSQAGIANVSSTAWSVYGISDTEVVVGTAYDTVANVNIPIAWSSLDADPVALDTTGLTDVSWPKVSPNGTIVCSATNASGDLVLALWTDPQGPATILSLPSQLTAVSAFFVTASGSIALSGPSSTGNIAFVRNPS